MANNRELLLILAAPTGEQYTFGLCEKLITSCNQSRAAEYYFLWKKWLPPCGKKALIGISTPYWQTLYLQLTQGRSTI